MREPDYMPVTIRIDVSGFVEVMRKTAQAVKQMVQTFGVLAARQQARLAFSNPPSVPFMRDYRRKTKHRNRRRVT